MCTFLLQNGALWDMRLVHCGICEIVLSSFMITFLLDYMHILQNDDYIYHEASCYTIGTQGKNCHSNITYHAFHHKKLISVFECLTLIKWCIPCHEQELIWYLQCLGVIGNISRYILWCHYRDVIMGEKASPAFRLITHLSVQAYIKENIKAAPTLAFVRGIHSHKGPVTGKMFPFNDAIMEKDKDAQRLWLYSPNLLRFLEIPVSLLTCNIEKLYYNRKAS